MTYLNQSLWISQLRAVQKSVLEHLTASQAEAQYSQAKDALKVQPLEEGAHI